MGPCWLLSERCVVRQEVFRGNCQVEDKVEATSVVGSSGEGLQCALGPAGLSSCSGGLRPLVELCVRYRAWAQSWSSAALAARPLSLLQRGLAPRSKGKARAELRPCCKASKPESHNY